MPIVEKIDILIAQIKQQPLNADLRLSLIQQYCLNGDWTRALSLVEQYLKLNPQDQQTLILLKNNILCELQRLKQLQGVDVIQSIIVDCPIVQGQVALLNSYSYKNLPEQLEQNFLNLVGQLTPCSISLNQILLDTPFILDSDFRYATVCELFIQQQYYWLAWQDIAEIQFKDNQYVTDLLWRRGQIKLKNNSELMCFIPARYPILMTDTWSDELKLSQQTQWMSYGQLQWAWGQKVVCDEQQDYSFLDIQSMQLK